MKLEIAYNLFKNRSEMDEQERRLLELATKATSSAYAPYSEFMVGCALLLDDGEIITGSNQENNAYPSGMCAERTAFFHAGSQGKTSKIVKVAIVGISKSKVIAQPVTPCGGCRQVMLEYENQAGHDYIVLMQGDGGPVLRVEGIAKSLVPFGFNIDF